MTESRMLYAGRYLGLRDSGGWEFATRTNASAVAVLVAVTGDDEILLVEQFRVPVGRTVIELPAGLVGDLDDPHEELLTAARRELVEETGYEASDVSAILTCPSSAGMTDEMITFVRATGLRRVGDGGGDASEAITVHRVPMARVDAWLAGRLAEGTPLDPKIYTALYWLRHGTPATDNSSDSR
ncbi:NUDIX hydrolase [Elongatibacter sediminis]|uniref:GDP-mannose pyrophosphatase n=1 Tax=Elongatibacter sediminis TaxID=3119006 RepID=A0AAW9R7L5_9GAMM